MLDTPGGLAASPSLPPDFRPESYTVALASLRDGGIRIALTATTFDEQEPQLLDTELAVETVPTLDDALALIRANVAFA